MSRQGLVILTVTMLGLGYDLLSAVFSVVVMLPALWSYFGLMGPESWVFHIVLLPWFAALSAALRFRLLDRLLGLDDAEPDHQLSVRGAGAAPPPVHRR
ncbi:hypothetical protein SAMN04489716_0420 [Actinoplanes derwentensis]|uniref:Uncharacterized protein n=1 Tax=Actinoplanes derwentensis TaxID=113562 RepID=A0A1H1QWF1_9ACTN|nr:hypothetical protein SAMN04489716_0420 [Actinoplanes derwentensis]